VPGEEGVRATTAAAAAVVIRRKEVVVVEEEEEEKEGGRRRGGREGEREGCPRRGVRRTTLCRATRALQATAVEDGKCLPIPPSLPPSFLLHVIHQSRHHTN